MFLEELMAYYYVIIKALLFFVALVFFVSGIDDFFFDIYYIFRTLYRKLFIAPKHKPLQAEQLSAVPEQPLCVMIPAWDESSVIEKMLVNFTAMIDYKNYHIFIGCYPNDPETQRAIEKVRERTNNVHRIVCPQDGPTNKSDCLNWVYQGVKLFEKENNISFVAFIMHDAEDIPHPLSFKLYNYLIPRKDMVQIPVFPLELPWYQFTGGHYKDEFAENHYKDLVVREFVSGHVPCAGVGCAFSRNAFEIVSKHFKNILFNTDSLTEDYDLSFRIRNLGLKQVFVRHAIQRIETRKSFWFKKEKKIRIDEYIATREFFPFTIKGAIRQKTRWTIGIVFQGWRNLKWQGTLPIKYMLLRDRKSLLTNPAVLLGYLIIFSLLLFWGLATLFPDRFAYPSFIEIGSLLWYLIIFDTFFMVQRLNMRAYCTKKIYGTQQAFLSVPRQIWGNLINSVAVFRAFFFYARYLLTGKLIAWDKTAHQFPSEEILQTYHRKLGDLLLEKRMISIEQLEKALVLQQTHQKKLGKILLEMNLLDEDSLLQILSLQQKIPHCEIDPYSTPLESLKLLPRSIASQYTIFPLNNFNNHLVVAVSTDDPLSTEQIMHLEKQLDKNLEFRLTSHNELVYAIQKGYERLDNDAHINDRIGQKLMKHDVITHEQLLQALKHQRRSYMRLGDILVEEKHLTPEQLKQALHEYAQNDEGQLGQYLVQQNYISQQVLDLCLQIQKNRFRRLGDLLIEMNFTTAEHLSQTIGTSTNDESN